MKTAIKEFVRKLESRRLLDTLNEAYSASETEEKKIRGTGKRHYGREIL